MNSAAVMTLVYKAMILGITLAAPVLLVTLVIGLVVSIFQAATQINESTLSFIPKIVGTCLVIILLGPWMIGQSTDFIKVLLTEIPHLVN